MNRTVEKKPDDGPKTPAWIVSFTDMITLLLAFFVMLQSFAKDQDPELFAIGRGSLRRAIAGLGVPDWLFGKPRSIGAEAPKKKNPTEESNKKTRQRVIDPEDERIREVFRDLKQLLETRTSDTAMRPINIILTPIRFERSSATLDARAKEYLADLAVSFRQNVHPENVTICVIGSAADQPAGRSQWIVSARRAKAAEDFLRRALSNAGTDRRWRMHSWGEGKGNQEESMPAMPASLKFIRIVVLQAR